MQIPPPPPTPPPFSPHPPTPHSGSGPPQQLRVRHILVLQKNFSQEVGRIDLQKASSVITARDIFKAHKARGSALSLTVLDNLIAHSVRFPDRLAALQASPPVSKFFNSFSSLAPLSPHVLPFPPSLLKSRGSLHPACPSF